MAEDVTTAKIIFHNGMPSVNCPHCGAGWNGWALNELARTSEVLLCKECDKPFLVAA